MKLISAGPSRWTVPLSKLGLTTTSPHTLPQLDMQQTPPPPPPTPTPWSYISPRLRHPSPKLAMPSSRAFLLFRYSIRERDSVADPGCLFRIPDPDFYPSRIADPWSQNINKTEGWKKICYHAFLCSNKFHKIENYFSFEVLILGQFSKN